jgi:hypothetical protein
VVATSFAPADIFVSCVLSPLAEGIVFQGALYQLYRTRTGIAASIFFVTLTAVLCHAWTVAPDIFGILWLSGGFSLFCLYRAMSGSLWPAIACHSAANITGILFQHESGASRGLRRREPVDRNGIRHKRHMVEAGRDGGDAVARTGGQVQRDGSCFPRLQDVMSHTAYLLPGRMGCGTSPCRRPALRCGHERRLSARVGGRGRGSRRLRRHDRR